MDELKDAVAHTNELLAKLLQNHEARARASEEQRQAIREKMSEDPTKGLDEMMAKARRDSRSPDLEDRMKKMREDTDEARRCQQEFNDQVISMLAEQTVLLTRIAEKLEKE